MEKIDMRDPCKGPRSKFERASKKLSQAAKKYDETFEKYAVLDEDEMSEQERAIFHGRYEALEEKELAEIELKKCERVN